MRSGVWEAFMGLHTHVCLNLQLSALLPLIECDKHTFPASLSCFVYSF